jgi:hypothetical protein
MYCIHLRNLNVRKFGIVETTKLKKMVSGHLQWHYLPTKFNVNPPIGSKVTGGGHTDAQTAGDLTSLLPF